MQAVLVSIVAGVASAFRSRRALQLEVLALRHQLAVYQRAGRRARLGAADRIFWALLSRIWPGWRDALIFVQPRTVIAWQRKRFRDYWTLLSRQGKVGRPLVAKEIRDLIRKRSDANPTWGSPCIMGELRKLGLDVAKSTVEKYRISQPKPPSPTWWAFLANHAKDLVSIDFFTVATVRFEVPFVLIILAHDRRHVRHFNITAHPIAAWTAQQIVDASPWETAPRYLLRDRDGIYGAEYRRRVQSMEIEEVLTAPRSPWQSPYVERIIGSIRRECLDNVVVLNRRHLHRVLGCRRADCSYVGPSSMRTPAIGPLSSALSPGLHCARGQDEVSGRTGSSSAKSA